MEIAGTSSRSTNGGHEDFSPSGTPQPPDPGGHRPQYIETGEPVSSRAISKRFEESLSTATIRNIMADLEDGGFLYQPHTSAGRVPTAAAYRFFAQEIATQATLERRGQGMDPAGDGRGDQRCGNHRARRACARGSFQRRGNHCFAADGQDGAWSMRGCGCCRTAAWWWC